MMFKILLTNCLVLSSLTTLFAQTPCEDGMAGDYPCNNVNLLGHVTATDLGAVPYQGVYLNDIWGWTDAGTGHEYALVGMANGTSFVDITDPLKPVVIGMLPEHHSANNARFYRSENAKNVSSPLHDFGKSVWRDIKVYNNHAYMVADADSGHGMQVFDLTELRNYSGTKITFKESGHYNGVSSAHNIAINEESGYAYIVGADDGNNVCNKGGLHIVDLSDPKNPVYAGCFDSDGYTHDAQIVMYTGPDADYAGKEIAFAANEDAVTIVDVTSKSLPTMIASKSYDGVAYCHQGWLTPDQRYYIANDELDETRGIAKKTTSYIWDVIDLDNPQLIGKYLGPYPTIDHNLYTRDNFVFEANYTSGLRILDATDISTGSMAEVAYFDTYPKNNGVTFDGAWSNYPYFASGNIIVSDIENGLFILQPTFLANLDNVPKTITLCQGDETVLDVKDLQTSIFYQWQLDLGNGFADLAETENFSKVTTLALNLKNLSASLDQAKLRLKVIVPETSFAKFSRPILLNVGKNITGGIALIADRNTYQFTAEDPSSADTEFEWDFGDGTTSNEKAPVHTYMAAGEYEVKLTRKNICNTVAVTQTITLDQSALGLENPLQQDIILHPNPANVDFTIQSGKQLNRIKEVYVYNANGALVYQQAYTKPNWEAKINLEDFSQGYYLVRIVTDKTSVVRPVIKN